MFTHDSPFSSLSSLNFCFTSAAICFSLLISTLYSPDIATVLLISASYLLMSSGSFPRSCSYAWFQRSWIRGAASKYLRVSAKVFVALGLASGFFALAPGKDYPYPIRSSRQPLSVEKVALRLEMLGVSNNPRLWNFLNMIWAFRCDACVRIWAVSLLFFQTNLPWCCQTASRFSALAWTDMQVTRKWHQNVRVPVELRSLRHLRAGLTRH